MYTLAFGCEEKKKINEFTKNITFCPLIFFFSDNIYVSKIFTVFLILSSKGKRVREIVNEVYFLFTFFRFFKKVKLSSIYRLSKMIFSFGTTHECRKDSPINMTFSRKAISRCSKKCHFCFS